MDTRSGEYVHALKAKEFLPSIAPDALRKRAKTLCDIRKFFSSRSVLEVQTPSLCLMGSVILPLMC